MIPFKSCPTLSDPDRALVVVEVAESPEAPHAVENRTTVYLRGDNVSTRIERKATVGEVEWLLNKRQKSLELKSRLLANSADRAEKIRNIRRGRHRLDRYWKDGEMTLSLTPAFPREPLLSVQDLFKAAQSCRVDFTSAPRQVPAGAMRRVSGGVIFDGESSFSEYQTLGSIFHQFDYWWDYYSPNTAASRRQLYPGATADLFASVLSNAAALYQRADYCGTLEFDFVATGLSDAFFASPRRPVCDVPFLTESQVRIERTFTVSELTSRALEIAADCQRELYWAFGFDAPCEWLEEDFKDFC